MARIGDCQHFGGLLVALKLYTFLNRIVQSWTEPKLKVILLIIDDSECETV